MIIESLEIITAFIAGRYLLPSKKARKMMEATFQRLTGTYRDPAIYKLTWTSQVQPIGYKDQHFKVKNIAEIPEPYRTYIKNTLEPRHRWLDNFLTGKDSKEE